MTYGVGSFSYKCHKHFADLSSTTIQKLTSEIIDFATDASRNIELGAGGNCGENWFILQWEEDYITDLNPSISYLELYALTIGVILYIHKFQNKRVTISCDNMAVVYMINSNSSACKNCMFLIRLVVLQSLIHNVKLTARHVASKNNLFPDLLSRLKYKEFRRQARRHKKHFNNRPDEIPDELWPPSKIWLT